MTKTLISSIAIDSFFLYTHFVERIRLSFYGILLLFATFIVLMGLQPGTAHAQDAHTPTPTYDPLVEPVIPENPNEYDLGRNGYWHHCMPCHGDRGQGLTDEWRAAWVADHQDCWGRGCHAGKGIDDSFAIPTVVPPVVTGAKLARFSSLQGLYDYLKATHPPQYPGHLSDEEYHAIAVFVFSMNNRLVEEPTSTLTIAPTLTATPSPAIIPIEGDSRGLGDFLYIILGIVLVVIVILGIRNRR